MSKCSKDGQEKKSRESRAGPLSLSVAVAEA